MTERVRKKEQQEHSVEKQSRSCTTVQKRETDTDSDRQGNSAKEEWRCPVRQVESDLILKFGPKIVLYEIVRRKLCLGWSSQVWIDACGAWTH